MIYSIIAESSFLLSFLPIYSISIQCFLLLTEIEIESNILFLYLYDRPNSIYMVLLYYTPSHFSLTSPISSPSPLFISLSNLPHLLPLLPPLYHLTCLVPFSRIPTPCNLQPSSTLQEGFHILIFISFSLLLSLNSIFPFLSLSLPYFPPSFTISASSLSSIPSFPPHHYILIPFN